VQKNKKTGLPDTLSLRHDKHFVDFIADRARGPTIRMIPINKIDPNPRQARSELGNIKELMLSIKNKGILEPILVRPKEGRYEIIAGERRYMASKRIGLNEIPCIEMNVEDNEALELALIENLQRKDLDVFEEAEGIKSLADNYGYNHSQIAEVIGKARSTITEIINVCKIPEDLRKYCKENRITTRSVLIEIAKQKNRENMIRLISEIKNRDLKREDTRDLSKKIKGKTIRGRNFVYNYASRKKNYKIKIEFKKSDVTKDEIIKILEEMINKLKSSKGF